MFLAVYMPDTTLSAIQQYLVRQKTEKAAINVNGTPLYCSILDFPADMKKVLGKSILAL